MAEEDSREREAEGGEDWYRKSLQVLWHKYDQRRCSEADVSMHLIRPCIQAVLRYPQSRIDAEASMERKRPDYVCRGPDGRAEVIVEVKNLNAPLTERVSFQAAWHTSPYGQISRYLEKYPIAQDGTWGVVTNGQEWIILRRNGQDVHQVASDKVENLAGIERILEPILESKKHSDKIFKPDILSQSWLDLLKNPNLTPTEFVQRVQPFRSKNLLTNRGHSFTMVKEFSSQRSVWLSCLNINLPDGHVSPADITEQLLPIIEDKKAYRIYGIACWKNLNQEKLCRGFLWQQGILSTTSALDPHFPGSRGDRQIRELAETATCFDVGDILSSIELKREFYEEIDRWFERTKKSRNNLRHMIRILFTYLLQKRGIIPDTCLWDISKKVEPDGTEIHEHIQWLFTSVFAIEKRDRYLDNEVDHSKHWLIKNIPFMNGSIFTPMPLGEEPAVLKNRSYIAVGEQPGLLTILRRYDWTLHEQSGYESESALDPSMLGTLFERLMLSAEGARVESGGNIKMPGGSYYTPQDVVDEMAAEAIAHWLHGKLGHLQFEQVRDLAHPAPKETAWKQWGQCRKNEVRERLSKVTVFDPCCGSGAFTVGMLQALRRANRRLADGKARIDRPGSLEWIVEKQLHAADIHPLAVLITRLRLFIALIDARESNTD
ncbi:MAG: hypothetical protein OXD30_04970 [Bryobacterales bacterium]|nr:hypothetical protein [Bryobacterales bacterium]